MNREYHKGVSSSLGRTMEMLVFGQAGLPVLVFPTSGGRFFDAEDHGLITALEAKIEGGQLQLFCLDSLDAESWYNLQVPPRLRVARHLQFERYIIDEVIPAIRGRNQHALLVTLGFSLGGYHAVNIALRHPETITGFVSLSGMFDLTRFLDGYYDQECYFNLPMHYVPNLTDPWYLDRINRNAKYVLATGWDDQCLAQNQALQAILAMKAIPHQFFIWDRENSHDWSTWCEMAAEYL